VRRLGDPKSLIGALGELPKTPLGAARLASESDLPENRLAEGFHEISLIATGRATQVNWERLRENPAQAGRLNAVMGALRLDSGQILRGPVPESGTELKPRHQAEWFVSYGWACLHEGRYEEVLDHFQSPFIHRSEWDLRFIRDGGCSSSTSAPPNSPKNAAILWPWPPKPSGCRANGWPRTRC